MSDTEFAAFVADIRANGQSDPIWIFEGKVIDGRHRLRACRELGIEPKFQEWDGKGSLTSFRALEESASPPPRRIAARDGRRATQTGV